MIITNHDAVAMVNTKITYCSKFIECKTTKNFSNKLTLTSEKMSDRRYNTCVSKVRKKAMRSEFNKLSNIT